MRTLPRNAVFQQKRRFEPIRLRKVLVPAEVAVENPFTKELERSIVNTYKEETLIDPHLKASDFSLETQIRSQVDLRDCGYYLQPSTPEEYMSVMQGFAGRFEEQLNKLSNPPQVEESVPSQLETKTE